MKFNKIASLALAAITAFSAVSASAFTFVPQPKNNSEAYAWAEAFYRDGYYYEARAELAQVDTTDIYYDENKQKEWTVAVNKKIAEYEYAMQRIKIKELIEKVKVLNSQYKFYEAAALLATATDYTPLEYYSLRWWDEAIQKNINSPLNYAIKTPFQAIQMVEWAMGETPLNSPYEVYSPVKVPGGYHVYVKTRTPEGEWVNVAAFRVNEVTGLVENVTPWMGLK